MTTADNAPFVAGAMLVAAWGHGAANMDFYHADSNVPVVPAVDDEFGDQWKSFAEVFKDHLAGEERG